MRVGRASIIGGALLALGLAGIAAAWVGGDGLTGPSGPSGPNSPIDRAEIRMRYSSFGPAVVTATAGQPIRIVLRNDDPIDHEWLVGDESFHERHRTGTEDHHSARPTEVSIPAGSVVTTTVTFRLPGEYRYICHLPGHEAYGMVGVLRVVPAD